MLYPYMQEKKSFNDWKESLKPHKRLTKAEKENIDKQVERINASVKREKVSK